jgi:hypothetical protein
VGAMRPINPGGAAVVRRVFQRSSAICIFMVFQEDSPSHVVGHMFVFRALEIALPTHRDHLWERNHAMAPAATDLPRCGGQDGTFDIECTRWANTAGR